MQNWAITVDLTEWDGNCKTVVAPILTDTFLIPCPPSIQEQNHTEHRNISSCVKTPPLRLACPPSIQVSWLDRPPFIFKKDKNNNHTQPVGIIVDLLHASLSVCCKKHGSLPPNISFDQNPAKNYSELHMKLVDKSSISHMMIAPIITDGSQKYLGMVDSVYILQSPGEILLLKRASIDMNNLDKIWSSVKDVGVVVALSVLLSALAGVCIWALYLGFPRKAQGSQKSTGIPEKHRDLRKAQGSQKSTGIPEKHRDPRKAQGSQKSTGIPEKYRDPRKAQGSQKRIPQGFQKSTDTLWNPEEFPNSFTKGASEGFWWAFVTMTTVGYGDRTPKSFCGRLFGVVWIIFGISLCSVMTATITTALTSINVNKDVHIIDKSVSIKINLMHELIAVLSGSNSINEVVKNFATPKVYQDFDTMYTALTNNEVDGILVEMYSGVYAVHSLKYTDLFIGRFYQSMHEYGFAFSDDVGEMALPPTDMFSDDKSDTKRCLKHIFKYRENDVTMVIDKYLISGHGKVKIVYRSIYC
ncbi:hypothetical protein QZH41_009109 [Actinostola sp. cb2023]|nr:hypothetical protein QZH41_009109 [Actinostola sp. cb2023]